MIQEYTTTYHLDTSTLNTIQQNNIRLFEYLHGLSGHSAILDQLFIIITSYLFLWVFCIAVLIYTAIELRHDIKRFGTIIVTLLSTFALVGIIKVLVAMPRPFMSLPDVAVLVAQPAGWSFPSGHTTMAFALATTILLIHRAGRPQRERRMAVFLYIIAVLVGFSRIYVGVHYPLDVLGGVVLGILAPWGISLSIRYWYRRRIALSLKKG